MCVGARSEDGGLSSPNVQRKRVSAGELTGEKVSVSGAEPEQGAPPPSAPVVPASTRAQPVTAKSSASAPGTSAAGASLAAASRPPSGA